MTSDELMDLVGPHRHRSSVARMVATGIDNGHEPGPLARGMISVLLEHDEAHRAALKDVKFKLAAMSLLLTQEQLDRFREAEGWAT